MTIRTIDVREYSTGSLHARCEGLRHVKTLPCLSVVQAFEGDYDVALGSTASRRTGENGVFIAQSAAVQTLVHHVSPTTGFMSAHWLFVDAVVNGAHRLDKVYAFPVTLPHHYDADVYSLLKDIDRHESVCRDLSAIYCLIDILLRVGAQREDEGGIVGDIVAYVCEHYRERIDYDRFAEALNISRSTLFRLFRSELASAPSHYINDFRVWRACELMTAQELSVADLAHAVGFDDEFYFSRCFKKTTGVSPSIYRRDHALIQGASSQDAADVL